MADSVYTASIRQALPRVLSMLDREPMSKSFGCADRVFWSWKFTDFPGARFQEIAYALVDMAADSAVALPCAKAAIHFWSTLQHGDGSFDEAYPYERSLAATAFTGFYVGQAFLKTKHEYPPKEQARLVQVFRSAGDWLCRNDEQHGILSNHLAAAAAALDTIAEITADKRFAARRDYFLGRIFGHQSDEGWYEEYGGADPGYQTHTTFYLAHVWTRTKDQKLLASLAKSVGYFQYFVHTDGSIGGEYGSRNTRFFMPAGFEMLADVIPEAAAVAQFMRPSIVAQASVGLAAMDAYNILPLFNNHCFARAFAKPAPATLPPLPFHAAGVTHFPHSGHMVISTPSYQAIVGASKGGVINAFAKHAGGKCWSDSGVAVEFVGGKKASSQGLHCSHMRRVSDTCIEIKSSFTAMNQMLMSPLTFAVFRAAGVASMLCPRFSYYLKYVLVKILVRWKKPMPMRLLRRVEWNDMGIAVQDELRLVGARKVSQIWIGGRFSAVHMGSSRYFEWQELAHDSLPAQLSADQVRRLNDTGKLVVKREWKV